MHQHYVTRARGKEGQAISVRGMMNTCVQLHSCSCAILIQLRISLLQQQCPYHWPCPPLPYNHGSHTRYTFLRIVEPWDISDIPAKPIPRYVAMNKARYLAPTWWFLLMSWWKHAWHGKYCRSMKKHSHRNKLIMIVGFRSAPQSLASLELLQNYSEISCILWEVHSAFFGLIALRSQPTQLFEKSQVIIPIKGRDCQITARHRIRGRWSRWPEDKFLGYDQLKPLRYSVS